MNLVSTVGGYTGIAGDFFRCGALFFHGGGDARRNGINFRDDLADVADRLDGIRRGILDAVDLLLNLLGGSGCLIGEVFDFRCDGSESIPCFAGVENLRNGYR